MYKAERSYRWLLWSLVLLGLSLDQFSKYQVFLWLYNDGHGGKWPASDNGIIRLLAEFQTDEEQTLKSPWSWAGKVPPKVNQGALFGLGNKKYGAYANSFFAAVSIAAALAIAYWSTRRTTARDGFLCGALGLIMAGTLGNLYDRVVFNGVRDFLHFYWFDFPVFNVADCCLVCGASLLLIQAFLTPHQPGKEQATTAVLATAAAEVK